MHMYSMSDCMCMCMHASVCVCASVSVSGYFASFLSVSGVVLPYEAEMIGSYVISPLSRLQVSNLDRKSEDLNPVLPAIVWLSYRSSTAVSAKKCCHSPCCQDHFDLGICHTCWYFFENKDSTVQRELQEVLLFNIMTFKVHHINLHLTNHYSDNAWHSFFLFFFTWEVINLSIHHCLCLFYHYKDRHMHLLVYVQVSVSHSIMSILHLILCPTRCWPIEIVPL